MYLVKKNRKLVVRRHERPKRILIWLNKFDVLYSVLPTLSPPSLSILSFDILLSTFIGNIQPDPLPLFKHLFRFTSSINSTLPAPSSNGRFWNCRWHKQTDGRTDNHVILHFFFEMRQKINVHRSIIYIFLANVYNEWFLWDNVYKN